MSLRDRNLARIDGGSVDVAIVGGGINGAVSAAALAARGASVALVEQGDFAGFTSQESSNLVWGGFKYLENYELPLVLKLSRSRNRLMRAYPTVISELRFLATLDSSAPFPSWLAALGTLGYWGLGQFATRPPAYHRPPALRRMEPIIRTDTAEAAVEYGDGYLKDNDARFVWSFVRSALDSGAIAVNYACLSSARRSGGRWLATVRDTRSGRELKLEAKVLVNAAGPFVDRLNSAWDVATRHRIVYSKGIHLVVPQLSSSERVLAFFDDSQRLFYVIPMAHRSVIGTTDTRTTNPGEPVTDDDRYFLLKQINARLNLHSPLTPDDVIAERCGVRPLVVLNDGDDRTDIDWTTLSRKHEVEVDRRAGLVTIFGGKLTDCLNVGEEVADATRRLGIDLGPARSGWYGEPPLSQRRRFLQAAGELGLGRRPEIEREESLGHVLWRRHGSAAPEVLRLVAGDPGLAQPVLAESDVLRAELPLYAQREMIVTLDDFLRRRTKLAMLHRADRLAADPGMDEVRRVLGTSGS
jgi:glycerol-3-phosphate dehydrogenase